MKLTNKNKFKYKILYEDKRKKEAYDKLDKLQKKYNDYEKGNTNPDEFITYLNKDLDLKVNENLKRIIKSPGQDKKSFKNIVKNLDFLNDNNTEYRHATSKVRNNTNSYNKDVMLREQIKKSII